MAQTMPDEHSNVKAGKAKNALHPKCYLNGLLPLIE